MLRRSFPVGFSPSLLCVGLPFLLAATTTICGAFLPAHQPLSRRATFLQRTPPLKASATPDNGASTNEFDFILREGGTTNNMQTTAARSNSRRLAVKVGGGDSSKVIAVSSVAVPNNAAETAEAMASLTEESATTTTEQQQQTGTSSSLDDDPYDSAFDAQMNKIQQYQEKQQTSTVSSKFKSMDLQDIILTLILPSILVFAAARWGFNRVSTRVNDKTDDLLERFASEMIFHDGDFEEMNLCIDDYNSKLLYLGPLKRDKLLKRYLAQYAKRKTISPQAIASLSYVFTQFSLSEESAAKLLVTLCRELGTEKVSSAGKLLFLGSRILKSPEGQANLQPIKDLIKSTYRDTDEDVADSMMETSQKYMAEASYRTTIQGAGKDQSTLTDGWQVLGLEKETAERIWKEEKKEGFVSARETMYGGQTRKYDKKGHQIDAEGKLKNPEDAEDDDDEGEDAVSNVYECGDCGFTLFVAEGRESKFFGPSFKCPDCGAAKEKFKARDDFGEED